MAQPWERDWGSAPVTPVYQAPTDPAKAAEQGRSARDQQLQEAAARRAELEWNATHNPDGTPKEKLAAEKPLPAWAEKPYSSQIGIYGGVKRGLDTFKDEYSGNSITGGLENDLQGIYSGFGSEGQRDWWAQFGSTDNVIRNDLFGAALTESEKAAYAATTVTPRMDPVEVKRNLESRKTILEAALKRRTNFLKAQGYSKDAIEALAGEYAQDLGAAIQTVAPAEPPAPGAPADKANLGTPVVPGSAAAVANQNPLKPDQQAAYDAWMKANPKATPDQLRAFGSSLGINLDNAEAIIDARNKGAGFQPAATARETAPDISDVRGEGGFVEGADAAVRGAADTLTLGFADELAAAGDTLFSGGTMDENLSRQRAIDKFDAENSPWLRGGGQLAGGIMLPIGAGAKTIRELAGVGGVTGAGYGIGSGETMGERATGGAVGGLTGAALGASFGKLRDLYKGRFPGSPPSGGGRAQEASDLATASNDLNVPLLPADAGGPITRYASAVTRLTPGGAQPITAAARRSQEKAGEALSTMAAREGPAVDPELTGETIRRGALKYRSGSRDSISRIYGRASEAAGDARVSPAKAVETLDRNIAALEEVPGSVDGLTVLKELRDNLTSRGTVSVDGIRGMRTQMRQKFIKDGLTGSDLERRVNEVVEAASEDMIDSLVDQGKPDAARLFREANSQWAERIKNLDDVIMPIIGKKGDKSGEDIAKALNAAAKGNNARLGKLFEILPEEEAGAARASLIENLGRAKPGGQNAEGSTFSFDTFLTNWNTIGNSAKNSIFRGENREAIDKLALIAEKARAASKYQNYSNTGLSVMGATTAGTGFLSLVTLGKVLAGQYIAGRVLASPKVAKALLNIAQAKTPQALSTRIGGLSAIAAKEPQLSAEITTLQGKLISAMNDNMPAKSAASEGQQENKQR